MDGARRITGRQVTAMVIAICLAVVLVPVGAMAATGSLVNITDPVAKTHKARVDSAGRLKIGDGSGALTVDGAVLTYPSTRAFSVGYYLFGGGATPVLKPGLAAGTKIMITSVTISPNGTSNIAARIYLAKQDGADAHCAGGHQGTTWFYQANAIWPDTFTASFATPVRVTDRCAQVGNIGNDSAYVVVTGYTMP
jgi:hypothetical protein